MSLGSIVRQQIHRTVETVATSISGEVVEDPSRTEDGIYIVPVEVPGGGYGGVVRINAVFVESTPGLSANSIQRGDIVLLSYEERGSAVPRITSLLSRRTAITNASIRNRGTISDTGQATIAALNGSLF